jgi:HEAT repeat protein
LRKGGGSGGFEQWEFWWEANDESFLDLKERLRRMGVTTGDVFAIRGARAARPATRRIDADEERRIVAALLAAVKSDEADVADSAVLALARIVPAERAEPVLPAIVATLGHSKRTARESATLALGVLGAPEAAPVLRELLLDTPEGRRLTGQSAVENLVRAFAAASLGMLGAPQAIADLERAVVDDSLRASVDVRSIALLSLGAIKAGHEQILPFLQERMGDRSLPPLVRAQAPIAIARLADQGSGAAHAALPSLVTRFADDKSDLDLLRSLAIALGRVATAEDSEAIAALMDSARRATDEQTRHFALMALADVGARDPEPARHAELHRRLADFFAVSLAQPKPRTERPWGALALAVHARADGVDRALRERAKEQLRDAFLEEKTPSYRAACAIALGLLGAFEAKDELQAAFADSRDQPFLGYVAVGFGLMLARDRADELREQLSTRGLQATTKLQFARALGLLGDPRAIPSLVAFLRDADTQDEIGSTAQALGLIGDHAAVAPLLELLGDERLAPDRRGFAAVALGLLGEKSELPWNAFFSIAANYRAQTPALREIFDIL